MKAALAIMLVLVSGSAYAQQNDAADADSAKLLYDEARKEMTRGEYTSACPKLESAKKLLPAHLRTRISLAECYAKSDRPMTATRVLTEALDLAKALGDEAKQEEVTKKLAELLANTPTLTLVVPDDLRQLEGFSISRDGETVPWKAWNDPIPVDYGEKSITVVAARMAPWSSRITIDHSKQQFRFQVEPGWILPQEGPQDAPPPTGEPPAQMPVYQPPPPWSPSPRRQWPVSVPFSPPQVQKVQTDSTKRGLGIAGITIGSLGLAGGLVLGSLAIARKDESNDGHCLENDHCDQTGYDLRKEAISLATASTGVFLGGALLLGGGVLLVKYSTSKEPTRQSLKDKNQVGLGFGLAFTAGRLVVGGSF